MNQRIITYNYQNATPNGEGSIALPVTFCIAERGLPVTFGIAERYIPVTIFTQRNGVSPSLLKSHQDPKDLTNL
jgi:hypothetical protein